MKTHAHDNAHAAQRRAVAHQTEHGDAAARLAQAGPAAVDHHVNHSPRMVAQRQLLGAAFRPVAQREPQGLEEELPVQGKALALQAKQVGSGSIGTVQAQTEVPAEANLTGMPNQLKSGVEALSGMDMSDVRVHRNSDKPAQLNALAYAQGNDIHLGPGQEQHLPHEAWHVVQQRQGRVQATMQMAGVGVNDDVGLEREADVMGGRAVQMRTEGGNRQDLTPHPGKRTLTSRQPAANCSSNRPKGLGRWIDASPRQQKQAQLIQSLFNHSPNRPETLQAKWTKSREDKPNGYYWEGDLPKTPLPANGHEVSPPVFEKIEDTHQATHHNMKSLRTVSDYPEQNMDNLLHFSMQAQSGHGVFSTNAEPYGIGSVPVIGSTPKREKTAHTKEFKMVTGEVSATKYAQSLNLAVPNTNYEITHGVGHSQGGKKTQVGGNLTAASKGANSAMIPYDDAVTGNTNFIVSTMAYVAPGTSKAEYINQEFRHSAFPDTPIFNKNHDGDRPPVTRGEWNAMEEEAKILKGPDEEILAAAALLDILRRKNEEPKDNDSSDDVEMEYDEEILAGAALMGLRGENEEPKDNDSSDDVEME